MSATDFEETARIGRLQSFAGRILAFWGVLVLAGLLVYSIEGAISGPSSDAPPTTPRQAAAPVGTPRASFTTASYGNAPRSQEFYIFMVCDGENVSAVYAGPISELYATLWPSRDYDLMVDLLEGRPTVLPDYSRTFNSPCFQNALNSGAFP